MTRVSARALLAPPFGSGAASVPEIDESVAGSTCRSLVSAGGGFGEATPPWRPTGLPPAARASGATRHPRSTTTRSTATSSRAPPFAHRPCPRRIQRWTSLRSVRRRRPVEGSGAATPPNRPSRASAQARRRGRIGIVAVVRDGLRVSRGEGARAPPPAARLDDGGDDVDASLFARPDAN